jgi:hypothetical protein
VENALKTLCEDKSLSNAGFMLSYIKQDIGKYLLYFIATSMTADIGLKMGGKFAIIKGFQKKFKEISAEVKEVKD